MAFKKISNRYLLAKWTRGRRQLAQIRLLAIFTCAFLIEYTIVVDIGLCADNTLPKPSTTVEATNDIKNKISQSILVPYIPGAGTPVVLYRETWAHAEGTFFLNAQGIPFGGNGSRSPLGAETMKPLPPRLAVWKNGTIIWSSKSHDGIIRFHESKLTREAVNKLIADINVEKYRTRENAYYSNKSRTNNLIPGASIAILSSTNKFILCSNLDQMELLKEYWSPDEDETKKYPFDQYSFAQFCDESSKSYGQYLKDYAELRRHVLAIIPPKGRSIKLDNRIRWVVLPIAFHGVNPEVSKEGTEKTEQLPAPLLGER